MPDDPTTRLVVRLVGWLYQQPEWVQVFAHSRAHRRAVARAIAKTITTIPTAEIQSPETGNKASRLHVVRANLEVPKT